MRRRRWPSPSTRTWSSNSRRRVPTKRSAKAFLFGVRTAVRTTLVPTASNRLANRARSLASRSTTSTSGWTSKVAFRACCAHQSSDGARVTAACMILRLFRSRKNRTKIGRKSTSKVCTKSQAQVTWLRRKVLQRWPSPGTCPLPKLGPEAGRWATVMRAMERNVPRTRSVGCSSRGAQNPHRPYTREPGAPAAARPAPPQIEATEIRATRSRLLDVALAVVDTVERSAPCRKTADGNSLAPAELSRFLDLEVPPRASGQTTGRRGACGSRAYHGAGEPALGRATHPRRIAEARVRRLAAHRGAAYAASPETTIADMEDVPPKPRRRPCLSRFLRRADCDIPNPLRVRGPAAPSPASRALQRHGLAHCRLDGAANCRSLSRRFGATLSPPRSRQHLRWRVSATGEGHVHRRGSLVTTLPLAEPLRRTSHRHPPS